MKRLVSTKDLTHEEWLKYRKMGVGGSDAGAICGLNPYSSPMSVYYDKTNAQTEDIDNESMRQGRDLEDYVARRFMEASGLKVRRANTMFQSEEHPFMLANVDRLIGGENSGLECKTASAYHADKWKDGEIPPHYLIQCYHYMAVTGMESWYIAVVILGREFKYAKIDRDESIISDLIQIEADFWNNHVLAGVMPDPDGSEVCSEIIKRYYPKAREGLSVCLPWVDETLKRREELMEFMGKMEQEKKQIEQDIKLKMGEAESAFSDHYRISWNNVAADRIDSKRMKAERPDLYREFSKLTQSRRFVVNAA